MPGPSTATPTQTQQRTAALATALPSLNPRRSLARRGACVLLSQNFVCLQRWRRCSKRRVWQCADQAPGAGGTLRTASRLQPRLLPGGHRLLGGGVRRQVVDRVRQRRDLISLGVRNLQAELLLQRHRKLPMWQPEDTHAARAYWARACNRRGDGRRPMRRRRSACWGASRDSTSRGRRCAERMGSAIATRSRARRTPASTSSRSS